MRVEIAAVVIAALTCGCAGGDPARLAVTARPPTAGAAGVDTRFDLRNAGGRTLLLDGVVSACGCAPTSRLPDTLAPGSSASLDVHCRARRDAGPAVRTLHIRSSDPASPETEVTAALPDAVARTEPAALYFGYVAVGESATRDVVVPGPLGELAPLVSSDFTVTSLPDRADGAHAVRVTFTPRRAGVVRTVVDLGAIGGMLPATAVAYTGVMAFPAELRVPRPSGAAGLPSITLVARGAAGVTIGQIDYPAGISGELRAVVPGRQFRLALRGHVAAGADDQAIRFRRDAGSDPFLVVPVVALAGAGGPRP